MYPYNILSQTIRPFPLLGDQFHGAPYLFDFIEPYYENMPVRDLGAMSKHNAELLRKSGKTWGIGGYLDDRSHKLKGTHIYDEGRVFHLGMDLMTQEVADIYNPLDGTIFEVGYESGVGNYGGYIIMRYSYFGQDFYTLFGHMDRDSIGKQSGFLSAGEKLGRLGTPEQNGNWVPHLHFQVFTGTDMEKWKLKGYCTLEDMRNMQYICPHPGFLLTYNP